MYAPRQRSFALDYTSRFHSVSASIEMTDRSYIASGLSIRLHSREGFADHFFALPP